MAKVFYSNPTSLCEIPKRNVEIIYNRNLDTEIQSFTINRLEIDNNLKNINCDVYVIVYNNEDEERFCLGSSNSIVLLKKQKISILDKSNLIFRVIISDLKTKRIRASCEGIRCIDENGMERNGLFHVEYIPSLGQKLWDLKIEGNNWPLLRINSNESLGLKRYFDVKDPFVRGLIVPQALERGLVYLVLNPTHSNDPSSWQNVWVRFLEDRSIELPPEPEEIEELDPVFKWAKEVSTVISDEIKFVSLHQSKNK